MACNLIAPDLGDAELKNFLKTQEFETIVQSLESESKKKITLVEVYLSSTLERNIEISYYDSSLSVAGMSLCEYTLKKHLGLNAELINKTKFGLPFGKEVLERFHFCKIGLSESSVQKNHTKLSERYKDSFSSLLYVNTQVPFIQILILKIILNPESDASLRKWEWCKLNA